ncbi:MAG: hypothetical protein ACK4QP_01325 [Pseudorhizobium sp.]
MFGAAFGALRGSHITFIVQDLDRMESILTTVFSARKVYDSGVETFSLSKERFFLIGEGEQARARVPGEGHSIYFYDYDNHMFELHTGTLQERLARYAEACRNTGAPLGVQQ